MKPARKRVALVGVVDEAKEALRELLIDRPQAWFDQARERLQNLPKTNFDLGCAFADSGDWLDAIFRFRVAAYFQPEYPQVWYNLGCCYFRTGRLAQAQAALQKALQHKPGQQEAVFMLAAINPNLLPPSQRPQHMPTRMVNDFFSSVAESYDIEEARSKYQAGKVIHELMKPLVRNPAPMVLDLACGTGIAARPWRAAAREIVGIDSTPAMMSLAAKATHADKKLFDQLIEADITALPPSVADGSADLVQLVNAAQFVGDLAGVMRGVARVLHPEGVFVLTVEPYAAAGFGVSAETGRFGHAPAYVKQVAQAVGLKLVKETPVQLYPEVSVQALVFSKGGM